MTRTVAKVTPRARPAAAGVATLVALLWIGLAVVAVRELGVAQGWATGSSWLRSVLDAVDGRTADGLAIAVGVVLVVLGLVVLRLTFKPGRITHLPTTEETDVWFSRGALAALAHAVADRQPGVVSVDAVAGRRKVTVHAVAREDAAGVEQRIRAALAERLDPLTKQRYVVRVSDVQEVAR